MPLLKVRIYPDPILKQKALPLEHFGPEEQKLFDNMIDTMYVEDGVGLAAPQVGISRRVLIASPNNKKNEEIVIVNPQILESQGSELGMEGCLSFPDLQAEIRRAKKIRLRFQDRYGKTHEMEIKDFFARVVQHEMDHLEGILLLDRMSFDDRQEALARYQVR